MSFRVHQWTQWVLHRGQEMGRLAWHGLRSPSQFQHTVVHQAQHENNRTALTLLRTQKEWNDMRYYGLALYLRQKMTPRFAGLWPSSLLSSTENTQDADTTTGVARPSTRIPNASAPAKVAFMVTGRMKEQLGELGYSSDEIKQLKPVEASLLLEHSVAPDDRAEKLPQLIQEHEEEQQNQQATLQAASQPATLEIPVTQTPPETASQREAEPTPSLTQQLFGSIASANVLHQPTDIASRTHVSANPRTWYEVVEEYKDGSESEIVALHSTEEEAREDADLRLEIITKRAEKENRKVNVDFKIRKTSR